MKHVKRRLLAFILSAMMILTTVMPTWAAEPETPESQGTEQTQVPDPGNSESKQPSVPVAAPTPDNGSIPASSNHVEAPPSTPVETPEMNAEALTTFSTGTNTPAGEPGNAVPVADPQKQMATITFKSAGNGFLNGASSVNPPIIYENVEVGSTVPVPTTNPTLYYEFAYWKNSTGEQVNLGETVTVGEQNETYTAHFALGKYTITFRTENEKYGTLAKSGTPVSEIVIMTTGLAGSLLCGYKPLFPACL